MAYPSSTQKKSYTYGDYLDWPEEERWEILEGSPYNMSPAPSRLHQKVVGELFRQIGNFLIHRECEVYTAPFDVRLPEAEETDEDTQTVIKPDIVVVCNPDRLDDRGCRGAPDFIIEVLSPSTAGKDLIEKAALYEKHGVKEYWAVHPTDCLVYVHILDESGDFAPREICEARGSRNIQVLPGLTIDFNLIFETSPQKIANQGGED